MMKTGWDRNTIEVTIILNQYAYLLSIGADEFWKFDQKWFLLPKTDAL